MNGQLIGCTGLRHAHVLNINNVTAAQIGFQQWNHTASIENIMKPVRQHHKLTLVLIHIKCIDLVIISVVFGIGNIVPNRSSGTATDTRYHHNRTQTKLTPVHFMPLMDIVTNQLNAECILGHLNKLNSQLHTSVRK